MNDKVSIIIPAYNSADTIERCVDSILLQTYKNIEIIVVNDGSTDNTDAILKEKYGGSIRIISQKNQGVSVARNTGVKKSEGSYVMFADSDDIYEKNLVETMMRAMKRTGADIVKSNVEEVYKSTSKRCSLYGLRGRIIDTSKVSDAKIIIDNFFGEKAEIKCLVMTLLIKKEVLTKHKIEFNKKLYMMEDVVYFADLFHAGVKIYFEENAYYNYYQNSASVSHCVGNELRLAKGVVDSNEEISKKYPNFKTIDNRHLKIAVNIIARNPKAIFGLRKNNILKNLALKTDFDKKEHYWNSVKKSIIHERNTMLLLLLFSKWLKNCISKKDMI